MVSVDEFENEFECYFYDITNKLKLNQIYFKNNYLKMNANKRLIYVFYSIITKRLKKLENWKRESSKKNSNKLEKNFYNTFKQETIEPIESWTLHGLPNVIRSKYIPIKIIWTIIFLAALGVSIYFLVNTIKEYLKYEVTTVVRSINEEEMDFPIITVCFTNKVVNSKRI